MRSFSLVNFGPRREAESVLDTAPKYIVPIEKSKTRLSFYKVERSLNTNSD